MNHQISWFLSSNPALGAANLSRNGSYFDVFLQEAFRIPENAFNTTVEMQSAVVWNQGFNIIDGVNNVLTYTKALAGIRQVIIPPGNYDLHTFSGTVERLLLPDVPAQSLSFQQKGGFVEMFIRVVDINNYIAQVEFNQPLSPNGELGFLPLVYVTTNTSSGDETTYTGQEAGPIIDGHRTWILSSSLCTRGVRINDVFLSALQTITFAQTPPNSQYVFTPPKPLVVPTDLSQTTISTVTSYLTDARTGTPVDTQEQYWSYVAVLRFIIPLVIPRVIEQTGQGKRKKICC